ncbi:CCA tRNA nucleotidyltransferase [Clostridium sp. Cult1]|uniref:CCA tRNA nucleotidyltransferase n=1 Tax=Clostridium sp. Cult1 TaxID=2079002 RepID=UPI001EFF93A4|nr:CCA tRNA nucleotidyltransferase [Clostridium sp. Cult1]MCF6462756.1 CCA tRNA nucleotidyltransferase [Clostridium sp. Cult1]
MTLDIPDYVELIIERLERKGYEAYLVGGSVRDMLLGKTPTDYDIATSASPDEIESVFSNFKTIDIGKKFGTIIVSQEKGDVEITTFRKEGKYLDGRRPEWVSFCSDVKDDLSRRDFTINAIAYNKTKGILDPFEGREDLKRRIIKTVGNPEERFNEDYLRILRAARFASQLEFTIDESTFQAGKQYSSHIKKVSMERIFNEVYKLLLNQIPSYGIRILEKMGVLKVILPEIIPAIGFKQYNPHHEMDVYNHILCVLDNTPSVIQIRLAALFHDIGKPYTLTMDEEGIGHFYGHDKLGAEISKEVLKRFKASNNLIEEVYNLVKEHMNHHANFKDKGLKRLIRRLGEEEVFHLIELQIADIKCSNKEANVDHIIERRNRIKEILEKDEAYKIEQMHIDGKDLIKLGFEQGPIIGEILEFLLDKIIEEPELNDRGILKNIVLDKYSSNLAK